MQYIYLSIYVQESTLYFQNTEAQRGMATWIQKEKTAIEKKKKKKDFPLQVKGRVLKRNSPCLHLQNYRFYNNEK